MSDQGGFRVDLGDSVAQAPGVSRATDSPNEFVGLRLLPGEAIVRASRRTVFSPLPEVKDGLFLTQLRIIYAGRFRHWGFLPGGKAVRAAFIHDVDIATMATRRASPWVLISGLALLLLGIAGIASDTEENSAANLGAFILLLGLALSLTWLLLRREVIAFSVAGAESLEHGYFQLSVQDRTAMTDFLNEFFAIKHGSGELTGGGRDRRGFEV